MFSTTKNTKRCWPIMAVVWVLALGGLAQATWLQHEKAIASDGEPDDLFGFSVSIRTDYAIIGSPKDDDNGNNSGSAYIFKQDVASWLQQDKLTPSDPQANDKFGSAVSISTDYAVISSPGDSNSTGSAYIFKRDGSSWIEQTKLTASDSNENDFFGISVFINGSYAVIGAYGDDSFTGSAYIFKRDGENWNEQDKLTASDGQAGDNFGFVVSIRQDYAIIGTYGDDNFTGSAYIFKRNGSSWTEQAKLTASDAQLGDYFGISVDTTADHAIIGAYRKNSHTGSAYVFKRNGSSWAEQTKLTASDGNERDLFGCSVSLADDSAIVGAYLNDPAGIGNAGSAYIFKRQASSWTEQAKLTISDGEPNDLFGVAISMNSNQAIVAAIGDDDMGSFSGSAYLFKNLPFDNFDDNTRGAMWRLFEDDPEKTWLVEDVNRLNVRAVSNINLTSVVGYWKMDDDAANTTVADSSGNANGCRKCHRHRSIYKNRLD
jgi:hypothetical protein